MAMASPGELAVQIRWEELKPTLVRKIGSGSFGQVYEAYYHCAPMAVKILQLDGDVTALPDALLRFKYAHGLAQSCCNPWKP